MGVCIDLALTKDGFKGTIVPAWCRKPVKKNCSKGRVAVVRMISEVAAHNIRANKTYEI